MNAWENQYEVSGKMRSNVNSYPCYAVVGFCIVRCGDRMLSAVSIIYFKLEILLLFLYLTVLLVYLLLYVCLPPLAACLGTRACFQINLRLACFKKNVQKEKKNTLLHTLSYNNGN